jgi:predicted O-linked N-acetylglucosamine transferase (SPINDLY family)
VPTTEDLVREAVDHARAGKMNESIEVLRGAAAADANSIEANWMLGTLLGQSGKLSEGLGYLERAWQLAPDNAQVAYQLGAFYAFAGNFSRGVQMYQHAVRLAPTWPVALNGLAGAMYAAGEYEQSDQLYRRSLAANPDQVETSLGLAGLLIVAGKPQDAVEIFRNLARLNPGNVEVLGKLASAQNYAVGLEPAEVFQTHARWGQSAMATAGNPAAPAFPNPRDPSKRLKIGFLSPDLYDHSVAYFLISYLRNRDRGSTEAVCFNLAPRGDWMTEELKGASDAWRDLAGRPEAEVNAAIRAEQVDILVELAGHTSGNSLLILRQRAAPVQATYIGYPNTTGLPTIDYRIVDAITDPPSSDSLHTEKLVRLDGCFLCYTPPPFAPEPGPPPCLGELAAKAGAGWNPGWFGDAEPVTFGSFNSIRKLSPPAIEAWCKVLHAVPGSRLALKTRGLGVPYAQRNLIAQFQAHGIGPERVAMLEMVPSKLDHWNLYRRIDIALDTVPYNGTTTTCEALNMGVPVVTLKGDLHASRVGASLLTAAGLPDLIAATPEEFVRKAAALAADRPALAALRAGLRDRLRASALCDGPAYARRMDSALRRMWRGWCGAD